MGIKAVVVSNVTESGAQVAWTTDVASSTELDWGLLDAQGGWTPARLRSADPDSTAHSVTLSGLQAGAAYRVQPQSMDNQVSFAYLPCDDGSSPAEFSTLAATGSGPGGGGDDDCDHDHGDGKDHGHDHGDGGDHGHEHGHGNGHDKDKGKDKDKGHH